MNNIKLIKDSKEETSSLEISRMEMGLSNGLQILDAVKNLKTNKHYLDFKRFVLNPSIDIVQKRLDRNIKDLVNNDNLKNLIFQDQGMLVAFKKFADFDELEKLYSQQTAELSKKLKELEK